jgi:phage terminase large subunit-like protein
LDDLFSGRPICWLVIPEGNGKTTLLAGIGLYWAEHKPGCRVLSAAAALDQVGVMYGQAERMCLDSDRMTDRLASVVLERKGKIKTERPRFECLEGWKRINHVDGGRFQVKAADPRTADGAIPDLCLVDELHRHRNLGLYRTWAGKLRKRGGQMIVISTAGEPGSEFETTREQMRQNGELVERGDCFTRSVSDKWVLHDWAVPEGGDIEDLEVVKKANPLSYVTVESLRETREAPGITVEHWSRINANVPARGSSAAIPEKLWHDAATQEQIPADAEVWVGMDFGWQWDTTAFVPLWWKNAEERVLGPAVVLEPPRDGTPLDPNVVRAAIRDMLTRYRVSTVVMDPDRAHDIAGWLADELGLTVIYRAQSAKPQGEDYERCMSALRNGWLRHSGDPALRQHALNAVARLLPNGGAKFGRISETRQGGNQDARVIDALVAAAMVHSVMADESTGSVYDDRGLIVIG